MNGITRLAFLVRMLLHPAAEMVDLLLDLLLQLCISALHLFDRTPET